MEKLTYSVKEMAEVLGIGVNKAYELKFIEGFPFIKLGTKKIIPKAALEKWLLETGQR